MRKTTRNLIAALALSLLSAGLLPAQQAPTVSQYTFEGVVGFGPRPSTVGEVWFKQPNREGLLRLAVGVRLGGAGHIRAVALGELNETGPGDEVGPCAPAPNGSCLRGFPAPTGFAIGLGVRVAATNRLGLGTSAGIIARDGPASFASAPFVVARPRFDSQST